MIVCQDTFQNVLIRQVFEKVGSQSEFPQFAPRFHRERTISSAQRIEQRVNSLSCSFIHFNQRRPGAFVAFAGNFLRRVNAQFAALPREIFQQ